MPGEPKNEAPFTRKTPNVHPHAPTSHDPPSHRDRLHHFMTATAGNAYDWRYREVRPLPYPHPLAWAVEADCSFAIEILCRWAAVADPTGGSYDGYGNSESMYRHLPHIALAEARVGDLIVFGPHGAWHATMIYTRSPHDPMLWSHGHQGAPNLYPLSADRRPFTVLRIEAP